MGMLNVEEIRFSQDALIIDHPCNYEDAKKFVEQKWEAIALTVQRFGLPSALIRYAPDKPPIEIWASLTEMIQPAQPPSFKIYTAPVIQQWSDPLLDAFAEMRGTGAACGMTDLETEDQIWINQVACDMLSIAGLEAVTFNMRDFFHPEDLERVNRTIRDTMEGRAIIVDYRCRLAASATGWASFSNTYKLVGDRYRLGVARRAPEPIPVPVGV